MSVADSFYRGIKEGIVTIDNVPVIWREKVQKLLDQDNELISDSTPGFETDETEV